MAPRPPVPRQALGGSPQSSALPISAAAEHEAAGAGDLEAVEIGIAAGLDGAHRHGAVRDAGLTVVGPVFVSGREREGRLSNASPARRSAARPLRRSRAEQHLRRPPTRKARPFSSAMRSTGCASATLRTARVMAKRTAPVVGAGHHRRRRRADGLDRQRPLGRLQLGIRGHARRSSCALPAKRRLQSEAFEALAPRLASRRRRWRGTERLSTADDAALSCRAAHPPRSMTSRLAMPLTAAGTFLLFAIWRRSRGSKRRHQRTRHRQRRLRIGRERQLHLVVAQPFLAPADDLEQLAVDVAVLGQRRRSRRR